MHVWGAVVKYKKVDEYITYTPPEEIAICEDCPYPTAQCGDRGCRHFLSAKKALEEKRRKEKQNGGKVHKQNHSRG